MVGLLNAWRSQRNMRIHTLAAYTVLAAAWLFQVSLFEWLALFLTITLVLTMEVLNTALETVVDLARPEYDPLAARAKDIAAGAVLLAAVSSVAAGVMVFAPRLDQPGEVLLKISAAPWASLILFLGFGVLLSTVFFYRG